MKAEQAKTKALAEQAEAKKSRARARVAKRAAKEAKSEHGSPPYHLHPLVGDADPVRDADAEKVSMAGAVTHELLLLSSSPKNLSSEGIPSTIQRSCLSVYFVAAVR
eukprot:scaffold6219_cov106-Skeletonema_dohrnii-CCMP3373.AAC.5